MDHDPQPQPQPEPEPQPDAQAAPKSESENRASGGAPSRRTGGEAYTDRPEFTGKPPRRWWPLALALALVLGVGGIEVRRSMPPAPPPVAAAQAQEVLPYTAKDYDVATTAAARAALARAKAGAALPVLSAAEKPTGLPAPAPVPAPAPAPEVQALRELAAAPQALRDDVASGRAGFYTFHLSELVDEGGDVYDITVDGVPLLRITTSPELTSVTIPLDISRPHTVTQTLVFARPRGVWVVGTGNGSAPPPANRASFSIQTSAGQARSHLSSAGESRTWSAQFGGAP